MVGKYRRINVQLLGETRGTVVTYFSVIAHYVLLAELNKCLHYPRRCSMHEIKTHLY